MHHPRHRPDADRTGENARAREDRALLPVSALRLPPARHARDAHESRDAELRVWAWSEAEYHHTVHGGLEGKTPLDRFLEDEAVTRAAPEDLDALMRMRVNRRVARDRTIRLEGRLYEAPDGFAGKTVEVRYDPYDPRRPVHRVRRCETT